MSYEDTKCPCGDKKPVDTMLCDVCMETFKDRKEMGFFKDGNEPVESRRHAATILLALSRGRKRLEKGLPAVVATQNQRTDGIHVIACQTTIGKQEFLARMEARL
jgi:hypothetical protein